MNRTELYQTFVAHFQEGQSVKGSEEEVAALEQELQIRLPASYRTYITVYGASYTPNILDAIVDSETELWDIASFIALTEVAASTRMYQSGGMPEDLIAFASDAMGNMFCLKRSLLQSPSDDSSVWFFDHDFCKVSKLFDSFDAWLAQYLKLKN